MANIQDTKLPEWLGSMGMNFNVGTTTMNEVLDFLSKVWEVISVDDKENITDILVGLPAQGMESQTVTEEIDGREQ